MSEDLYAIDLAHEIHLAVTGSTHGTNAAGGPHYGEHSVTTADGSRQIWIADPTSSREGNAVFDWGGYGPIDGGYRDLVVGPHTQTADETVSAATAFLLHGEGAAS